jgi:P-type conjugative transfer protein TrbG
MKKIIPCSILLTAELLSTQVFATDFHYHGDITAAVRQIAREHHLTVVPPSGDIRPISVDVDVDAADITSILRAIGDKAGSQADVIYNGRKRTVQIEFQDEPLPVLNDPVQTDALIESRRWQRGQAVSPVTGGDGLILYPYGQSQPTLTCSPLRACDIELQAGEEINNVIFGDTVRWISAPAITGAGEVKTPHVIVKPTEAGLDTNLIITTTKRTYLLTLRSASSNYTSRVGFFYPNEMVQQWNQGLPQKESHDSSNIVDMPMVSTEQLSFDYETRSSSFSWLTIGTWARPGLACSANPRRSVA